MNRQSYNSDISDTQWEVLADFLAKLRSKRSGRPNVHPVREIINALFYKVRVGCPWRFLPHDFPPHQAVSAAFYRWQKAETFEALHTHLREKVRLKSERNPTPTAAIIDSQSVKTAGKRGAVTGTMPARKRLDVSDLRS